MQLIKILLPLLLFSFGLNAQRQITEKSAMPFFSFSYAVQYPQADLAERFGWNSNFGAGFMYKTQSGWLWGIDAQYLFGNHLKEDSIIDGLRTRNGEIINQYGEYANILMSQRGYYMAGRFGKLININKKNPNSGIVIIGDVGFLEHKIRIENQGNTTPQLSGDYVKGYDRLTNGLALKGFAGYMHFGKSQFANFYVGVEYYHCQTQNRRSWNFDTMSQDLRKRKDNLAGIRIGWIIPIYRNVEDSYFTY
jgi:hypothetical protein